MKLTSWPTLAALILVVSACAPRSAPGADSTGTGGQQVAPSAPKTLTMVLEGEPENLIGNLDGGTGSIAGNIRMAVHQHLATYDDRGNLLPMLVTELPSVANGLWVVRPDGTMQTTYRLRRGVTWHDGKPLSPKDFAFAWTMTRDMDLPFSDRLMATQVSRVDAPDESTVVFEWSVSNPFANAIVTDQLGPFPAHLLESVYPAEKERIPSLPYWKRDFVGVGPYRVSDWQPGSHLVLSAYDGFFGGRAKIDTLVFRFIENPATAVASLLAGAIDGSIPRAVDFSQSMFVKAEWERGGYNPVVIVQPTHWRMMGIQFRAPQSREVLDVRVRKGLTYALDRQAMADTLLDGKAPVSDTFISPDDVKWDWVKDAVVRYEYSTTRAGAMFAEAGWRRGPDGVYLNAAGERFSLPVWTTAGDQNQQELAIIGDNWKAVGVPVEQTVLAAAQTRDNELRANFPGFDTTAIPATFDNTLQRVQGTRCPTDQNRWSGSNRGCYQNAENDRLIDGLLTAIDPSEQQRLYRDLVRLQSDELPVIPLYFNVQVTLFREGVLGVKGDTKPRTSITWNVAEWDLR